MVTLSWIYRSRLALGFCMALAIGGTGFPAAAGPTQAGEMGDFVSEPLAREAALYYAEQGWPGCRILSVTPYYDLDGSVNAYAVQFAKKATIERFSGLSGHPAEQELHASVAENEARVEELRRAAPEGVNAGLPPAPELLDKSAAAEDLARIARNAVDVAPPPPLLDAGEAGEEAEGDAAPVRLLTLSVPPEAMAQARQRHEVTMLQNARAAQMQELWSEQVVAASRRATLADEVGTVVIAGWKHLYPPLEAFNGVAPHIGGATTVKEVANLGGAPSSVIGKTYYLGPMCYFHEPAAPVGEGEAVDAFNRQRINLTGLRGRLGAMRLRGAPEKTGAISPQEIWTSFEKTGLPPKSTLIAEKTPPVGYTQIPNVPYLFQSQYGTNSCGPTAFANILAYHDMHGYGNLVDNGEAMDSYGLVKE